LRLERLPRIWNNGFLEGCFSKGYYPLLNFTNNSTFNYPKTYYSIVPAFQLERSQQFEKGVTKLEENKI